MTVMAFAIPYRVLQSSHFSGKGTVIPQYLFKCTARQKNFHLSSRSVWKKTAFQEKGDPVELIPRVQTGVTDEQDPEIERNRIGSAVYRIHPGNDRR